MESVRHATETHNSVGLVPAPTAPNSPRADRCANRSGATGGRFGVARPVDGPPETALNGDALIPQAKAPAGEPIRTSRMHAGESQSAATSTGRPLCRTRDTERAGGAPWMGHRPPAHFSSLPTL